MQWDLLSVSKMLGVEGQRDKCNKNNFIIRATITEEENRML